MATIKGGERAAAYLRDIADRITNAGTLRVGFLENATYPDGTPVALVAAVQNFGAPSRGIPPRPFFSNMIDEKSGTWGPQVAALLPGDGYDGAKTLTKMGEQISGDLRQSIVDTNSPALSPVTLLLRDRFWSNPEDITFADVTAARRDIAAGVKPDASGTQAKPLIWTAHMLQSVDYQVDKT